MTEWRQRKEGYKHLNPEGFHEPPFPEIESVEIPNTTAVDLFSRLAADFKMITNYTEARMRDFSSLRSAKRFYFSMIINDDEFYNKATPCAYIHLLTPCAL